MPWGSSRPHAQHSTAALAPQCPVHTHRKMATVKSATGSGAARLHLLAAGLPVLRQLHALAAQRLCAATTHSQSWRSCSVRLSPGALLVLGSVLARCWCWTQACPCERVCVAALRAARGCCGVASSSLVYVPLRERAVYAVIIAFDTSTSLSVPIVKGTSLEEPVQDQPG